MHEEHSSYVNGGELDFINNNNLRLNLSRCSSPLLIFHLVVVVVDIALFLLLAVVLFLVSVIVVLLLLSALAVSQDFILQRLPSLSVAHCGEQKNS